MGACCIDFEQPDIWRVVWRTARKQHQCCECQGTVAPGDTYERYTELRDGFWGTWITCEPCADLRESLMDAMCPPLGELRDTYREFLYETKRFRWDENEGVIIFPDNHLKLNDHRA